MNNLSELITTFRKRRGITQNELGEMLGISGKAISKWERGLAKPCDEHLKELINLLGLPIEASSTAQDDMPFLKSTFLSTVRKEFVRILSTGTIIASCICNLSGVISTDSTVVYLGLSVALFCFGTMIKG